MAAPSLRSTMPNRGHKIQIAVTASLLQVRMAGTIPIKPLTRTHCQLGKGRIVRERINQYYNEISLQGGQKRQRCPPKNAASRARWAR